MHKNIFIRVPIVGIKFSHEYKVISVISTFINDWDRKEKGRKRNTYRRTHVWLVMRQKWLCYRIALYAERVYLYRSPSGAAGPAHGPDLRLNFSTRVRLTRHWKFLLHFPGSLPIFIHHVTSYYSEPHNAKILITIDDYIHV